MDMRVELKGASPGVQHSQHAQLAADEFGIEADLAQGIDGDPHQGGVEQFLIATYRVPQFRWKSEDYVEVAYRQQFRFSLCHPFSGIAAMTGGAAAVLAGVIELMLMAAFLACAQMTSHGFGATGEYVHKGAFVARQHPATESVQIFPAVVGDDLLKAAHGCRSPIIPSRLLWRRRVIFSVTWV